MDRRSLIAVALCVVFLLAYQPLLRMLGLGRYLAQARRPVATAVDTTGAARTPSGSSATLPAAGTPGVTPPAASATPTLTATTAPVSTAALERSYRIETPLYIATFSNRGARLESMELKRFAAAHGATGTEGHSRRPKPGADVPPGQRVQLAGLPTFGLDLGSGSAVRRLDDAIFTVTDSTGADGTIQALTFTFADSAGPTVRETFRARPDNYALDLDVAVDRVPDAWRLSEYSLTVRSWPPLTESDMKSDENAMTASGMVGTNIHRVHAVQLLKEQSKYVSEGNAQWAAVQSRYFLAAVSLEQGTARAVVPRAEPLAATTPETPGAPAKPRTLLANSLVVPLPGPGARAERFLLYIGPSEYWRLVRTGAHLDRAVNLGWNWILPVSGLMLRILNWLYGVIHNYGVAIIVLATLARLVLHPLNMASMKSMRAMQKLQPEIERLKEKYKNDPTAMNTAMMALYKDNKVNPAGGCLPILLQMPILMALYQVLFNAIELRQAPFLGWISDLSAPDLAGTIAGFPIHVLPILMALSGLLQQRLTPTNPEQAPTMYLMNVFMLVIFYKLPSGLVLYWTVMNLLSALQQWMVLRQDAPLPSGTAVPVVATVVETKKRKAGRA